MQRLGSATGHDIIPYKSDGTYQDAKGAVPNIAGYTLANGTTYYYPLGRAVKDAPFTAVHIKWDINAILTITVEDTCFDDVNDWDTTAGNWVKEDPSTAYVAHDGASTVLNGTVSVPGGTAAGSALYHIANTGAMRCRLKVIVGGTGGVVRVAQNAKE